MLVNVKKKGKLRKEAKKEADSAFQQQTEQCKVYVTICAMPAIIHSSIINQFFSLQHTFVFPYFPRLQCLTPNPNHRMFMKTQSNLIPEDAVLL